MYEMLKVRTKPPLHGGAAFGVAYKELMPSLRNAWNSEAYDEDKRINRKIYEKTASALAAADMSTPIPPLRLRAVLTEATTLVNKIMETATSAKDAIDQGQNTDLSQMSIEWNELVGKVNPLLIGPVNVGMSDEDTNALHSLISNQLLQPLEMLQATMAANPGVQVDNEEVINSTDIARNILLQVRAKYYKPVPFGRERRAGPGMLPPAPAVPPPGGAPPPPPVVPNPLQLRQLRARSGAYPMDDERGFEEEEPAARVIEPAEELAGIYQTAGLNKAASTIGRAVRTFLEKGKKDRKAKENLTKAFERVQESVDRAAASSERARQVIAQNADSIERLLETTMSEIRNYSGESGDSFGREMADAARFADESRGFTPRMREYQRQLNELTPLPQQREPERSPVSVPPPRRQLNPGLLVRPSPTAERVRLPLSPPSPATKQPTPVRGFVLPGEAAEQEEEVRGPPIRRSERETKPAVSKVQAATESAEAAEKKKLDAAKKRQTEEINKAKERIEEIERRLASLDEFKNKLIQEAPRNPEREKKVRQLLEANRTDAEYQNRLLTMAKKDLEQAQKKNKGRGRLTGGYTIFDLGKDIKKFFGGNGNWTDYSGPVPNSQPAQKKSTMRGGNYRDTPMSHTGRQTKAPMVNHNQSVMDFNDESNDPNELGGIAKRDEMLQTENKEVHLDPDWKGLPKRLGAESRLKKMRKGYVNPRESY